MLPIIVSIKQIMVSIIKSSNSIVCLTLKKILKEAKNIDFFKKNEYNITL